MAWPRRRAKVILPFLSTDKDVAKVPGDFETVELEQLGRRRTWPCHFSMRRTPGYCCPVSAAGADPRCRPVCPRKGHVQAKKSRGQAGGDGRYP